MDKRKCAVCDTEFDFETSGLGGPDNVVVCGAECAKKSAEARGNRTTIHDKTGKIVDTNVSPLDIIGYHKF